MIELFLSLVDISIKASWLVLVVLLIRCLFRRIPKWILCVMWLFVGIRLIMPFSIQTFLSLLPSSKTIHTSIKQTLPTVHTGIQNIDIQINQLLDTNNIVNANKTDYLTSLLLVLSIVWIIGVICMGIYTIYSYYNLYKNVQVSLHYKDNVYMCDDIDTPFILGVLKPKIYVPTYLKEDMLYSVLQHENMHLKRKDHYYKPIGFILLTLYWFNPILWYAYILLCNDIEAACDEAVVKDMNKEDKKLYLEALLTCSVNRYAIKACPIAFGESDVKSRTKNIVKYKKPTFIITFLSILLCLFIGISFLTDPNSNRITDIDDPASNETLFNNIYRIEYTSNNKTIYISKEHSDKIVNKLKEVEVSKTAVSHNRSEDRDSFYQIGLGYYSPRMTYINISKDCDMLWIDDGVKPSLSYKVYNQAFLKELCDEIVLLPHDDESDIKGDIIITGGLVATVIAKDSSYVTIKLFQSEDQLLRVNDTIKKQIEVGKTYYFEIEPVVIMKNKYFMSVKEVRYVLGESIIENDWITVKSIREPKEEEMGLAETLFIEYLR